MQGTAANSETDGAIRVRDSSRDLVSGGASSDSAETDVLRNALSAVMVEYHEQTKRLSDLTAQNLQLRSKCSELEKCLFDIEASTSWGATKRLREMFSRHPRLRRLVTTVRLALARP